MPDVINFYYVDESFGEFSNFAPFPIEVDGLVWPTSEHYFQAQKFAGTEYAEAIRLEKSPMKAAKIGRDRHLPLRADWNAVKDEVMRRAVLAKFTQYLELRRVLLATGDSLIVEHTRNDSYWGDGGDGTGSNVLGKILMEVRERLRKE